MLVEERVWGLATAGRKCRAASRCSCSGFAWATLAVEVRQQVAGRLVLRQLRWVHAEQFGPGSERAETRVLKEI